PYPPRGGGRRQRPGEARSAPAADVLELLVTRATLPDGRRDVDIAVRGGRIAQVSPGIAQGGVQARETIDAAGQLVCPPFVDAHFHLDAALSYGLPRVNQSGTLLEG